MNDKNPILYYDDDNVNDLIGLQRPAFFNNDEDDLEYSMHPITGDKFRKERN